MDDFSKIAIKFALAVAHEEGFYVTGSIPARAHNPGDLKLGDKGFGLLGEGITVFQTDDDGFDALLNQIRLMLGGKSHIYTLDMTMLQVGVKYSGDDNWGVNVASIMGVSPETTLLQLSQM